MLFAFMQLGCNHKAISKEVLEVSGAENVTRLTEYETAGIKEVYTTEGELIQVVEEKGFKDNIRMMVSINLAGDTLTAINILDHKETHDYGGYVTEDWFLNRFKGKTTTEALKLVKLMAAADNEIVAITGATKTSQAVINGVNAASENYMKIKGEVIR